jgi:hypothetical protein
MRQAQGNESVDMSVKKNMGTSLSERHDDNHYRRTAAESAFPGAAGRFKHKWEKVGGK